MPGDIRSDRRSYIIDIDIRGSAASVHDGVVKARIRKALDGVVVAGRGKSKTTVYVLAINEKPPSLEDRISELESRLDQLGEDID